MSSGKQIVVSVDTEEEGRWGCDYSTSDNPTQNLRGLSRFQALCEKHGVAPTYLIDAPVLLDQAAIAELSTWQEAERCEVGAHCHPWCNPPIVSQLPLEAETFLCNLPVELQFEKLKWLTDHISNCFGKSPTSYRAGRYGFSAETTAPILAELGYAVDSSVLPMFEYRRVQGPDFRFASRDPVFIVQSTQSRILELPITSGFTKSGYRLRRWLWIATRRQPWKFLKLAGIADSLGFARRLKLSPEGTSIAELRGLVDACLKDGLSTLVLMLHSSSLAAGFSPYAKNAEALEKLYARLDAILRYAIDQHGCQPVTLTAAAKHIAACTPNDFQHNAPLLSKT